MNRLAANPPAVRFSHDRKTDCEDSQRAVLTHPTTMELNDLSSSDVIATAQLFDIKL